MIKTRRGISIDRPIDEVFEYLAHYENSMEWRSDLREIERVSVRPFGEGAMYRQRVHYADYDGEETVEVVGFEPNLRVSTEGRTGEILEHAEFRLTREDGSTKVEVSRELELSDALEPMEPRIAETVIEQDERDLDHLKDILEHRVAWRRG